MPEAGTHDPTFTMRRILTWIVMLALLAGAGWIGWRRFGPRPVAEAAFQTAAVDTGEIVQVVTATGQLNPVTNVEVGSQISGLIKELLADFNSQVKEGDVIARLDDSTFRANLLSAEGNLAQAEASLLLAQVQAKRNRELLASRTVSQTIVDQADADLARAQAQVKVAQASLARARVDLERCTIYSPVDGIVISRAVDVGQTVAASLNAPVLFTIAADLAKMQIIANVSEADIGQVEVGQRALFSVDAFPGRPFFGKVTQVRNAPRTVENVVTYDTVIGVDNEDLKLKPGMTANVQVVVAERTGVLRVPNSALRLRLAAGQFVAAPVPAAPAGAEPAPGAATPAVATSGPAAAATPAVAAAGGEAAVPGAGAGGDRSRWAGRGSPGGGGGEWPRGGGGSWRSSGCGEGAGAGAGAGVSQAAIARLFGGRGSSSRSVRTVYVLPSETPAAGTLPQAVEVRTGISDGQYTEVMGGLENGQVIVTSLVLPGASNAAPASPFQRPGGGNPFTGFR